MRTSRLLARPQSNLLFARLAGFYKKTIKGSKPEEYIELPKTDSQGNKIPTPEDIQAAFKVRKPRLGRKAPASLYNVKKDGPVPCIATLGPITVQNPEIFSKKYKWCSCGMSAKQVSSGHDSLSVTRATTELSLSRCESTYRTLLLKSISVVAS